MKMKMKIREFIQVLKIVVVDSQVNYKCLIFDGILQYTSPSNLFMYEVDLRQFGNLKNLRIECELTHLLVQFISQFLNPTDDLTIEVDADEFELIFNNYFHLSYQISKEKNKLMPVENFGYNSVDVPTQMIKLLNPSEFEITENKQLIMKNKNYKNISLCVNVECADNFIIYFNPFLLFQFIKNIGDFDTVNLSFAKNAPLRLNWRNLISFYLPPIE